MSTEKKVQTSEQPNREYKRWNVWKRMAYLFFILLVPLVMDTFFDFKYEGEENVPKEGSGFIIAVNHQSFFDPFFLASAISYRTRNHRLILWFGSKKVMSKKHFLWVRWAGAFPVDTEGGGLAQRGIDYSSLVVRDGSTFAIFFSAFRAPWADASAAACGVMEIALK